MPIFAAPFSPQEAPSRAARRRVFDAISADTDHVCSQMLPPFCLSAVVATTPRRRCRQMRQPAAGYAGVV